MSPQHSYGLEQARIQLPAIAANAFAGVASVITRHGKPLAAVVPFAQWQTSRLGTNAGILALQGTGQGLWGPSASQRVGELRDEWEPAQESA
jgi:antitoxin (DNA-binding transcriptional repressor) of toxin-antitoxin stability system